MIPKIIHYVWVGDKPKPKLVLRCIESWKIYCPDYKIVEWGNESLKEINNLYVTQAFENKKWAFVSDYLRLYALYHYGGFYCDSDLEITQNIDIFKANKFFTGYEKWEGICSPITAFMGAEKHNFVVEDLLREYDSIPFIVNGEMDQTTNVTRVANYFSRKFGLKKPYDGSVSTILADGYIIYPSYFFCTPENDNSSYSIHHFNGSWLDSYDRKNLLSFMRYKLVRFKKRSAGEGNYLPISSVEQKIMEFDISSVKKVCIIKDCTK